MCVFRTSTFSVVVVAMLAAAANQPQTVLADPGKPLTYPKARKCDQVDDYHGVSVPDPYRWLEDPDSEETRAWVEAQNRITFGYLDRIAARDKIKKRITQLYDYEKYGIPGEKGGRYFFEKNDGLQDQYVLYWMESLEAKPKVLLDPNKLSEDGTVALAGTAVSKDGKLLAYGLSSKGSDWQEWKIRAIDTGKDLTDHLKWIKFSRPSWTKDGKGLFYSRYDEPDEATKFQEANYFPKIYYHQLGTPQSTDELVFHRPDQKDWMFYSRVTDDGRYLIIMVEAGSKIENMLYYKDLKTKDSPVVELIDNFDANHTFIDNDGPIFWLRTDLNAPRGRVVAVDTRKPERANWKEVVPQAKETLRSADLVGGKFFVSYLKDAYSQVRVFDIDGKLVREVEFPGIGSAYGFRGRRDNTQTFYAFTGFATPSTIYRYDIASGKSSVFKKPTVDFDPTNFETKQVFFRSKDGTRVPMFIAHKKGLKLDGGNPTYLYGYGGFDIAMTPYFSVTKLVWMDMGGVFAMANIRGGGEYGKEWHKAGMRLKKQNVFDDFIAAAQWLIDNKYTSTPKLAIGGGSNGGLLVGACVTQRPDLFGAAVAQMGVMDMLRFHKYTIGWAWTGDYGSSDDPEQFKALYAYSPLHNLRPGTAYPATLVTTADHDDRVVPAHSYKFTAALQEAHSGAAPVLIRIQTKSGHGAGTPTSVRIQQAADMWAFLVETLDMRVD